MASQLTAPRDTILIARSDEQQDMEAVINQILKTSPEILAQAATGVDPDHLLRLLFDDGDIKRHGKEFLEQVIYGLTHHSTPKSIKPKKKRSPGNNSTPLRRQVHASPKYASHQGSQMLTPIVNNAINPTGNAHPNNNLPCNKCFRLHPRDEACPMPSFNARANDRRRTTSNSDCYPNWAVPQQGLTPPTYINNYGSYNIGFATADGAAAMPYYWNGPVTRRPRGSSLLNNNKSISDRSALQHRTLPNSPSARLPIPSFVAQPTYQLVEHQQHSFGQDDTMERFSKMSFKGSHRPNNKHRRHKPGTRPDLQEPYPINDRHVSHFPAHGQESPESGSLTSPANVGKASKAKGGSKKNGKNGRKQRSITPPQEKDITEQNPSSVMNANPAAQQDSSDNVAHRPSDVVPQGVDVKPAASENTIDIDVRSVEIDKPSPSSTQTKIVASPPESPQPSPAPAIALSGSSATQPNTDGQMASGAAKAETSAPEATNSVTISELDGISMLVNASDGSSTTRSRSSSNVSILPQNNREAARLQHGSDAGAVKQKAIILPAIPDVCRLKPQRSIKDVLIDFKEQDEQASHLSAVNEEVMVSNKDSGSDQVSGKAASISKFGSLPGPVSPSAKAAAGCAPIHIPSPSRQEQLPVTSPTRSNAEFGKDGATTRSRRVSAVQTLVNSTNRRLSLSTASLPPHLADISGTSSPKSSTHTENSTVGRVESSGTGSARTSFDQASRPSLSRPSSRGSDSVEQ